MRMWRKKIFSKILRIHKYFWVCLLASKFHICQFVVPFDRPDHSFVKNTTSDRIKIIYCFNESFRMFYCRAMDTWDSCLPNDTFGRFVRPFKHFLWSPKVTRQPFKVVSVTVTFVQFARPEHSFVKGTACTWERKIFFIFLIRVAQCSIDVRWIL